MSAKKEKDDCCKDPQCEESELSPEERLKKLYTIPAEVASQLPAEGLKRLEAVIDLQKEHDEEYKNLIEEVRAIQLRYEEKFVELYKKRQAIVVGEVDPASSDATKGIPEFWFNVLKNSTLPIEEHDFEPLKSLTNVEYELLPENKGYKLSFHFAPNDFFSNSVLTKTFHIEGFMSQGEEDVYLIDGTEIDWKSGKNVTVKLIEKKVGGGGRGGGRGGKGKRGGKRGGGGGGGPPKTVLVEEEVPSFFRFFEPVPDIEKIDPNEDQEAYIMVLQQYQQDQYLGTALKDKIIPQAPLYYNGVVLDDESDDEDGLYEMGSDEDEDDDEDERALAAAFQSARSQAGGKKRGGGGGSGGRGGNAGGAGGKPEGGLPFSFSAPAGGAAPASSAEGGAAPAPFKFSFNPPPAAAAGSAAPAAAASGEAAPFKFSFNATPK